MGASKRVHDLFIERRFADAIHEGRKTFEIRSLEHEIEVGDFLTFRVVDLDGNHIPHALERELYVVTYQLAGWHIAEGYGVYSIAKSPVEHFADCELEVNADELIAAIEEVAQPCG